MCTGFWHVIFIALCQYTWPWSWQSVRRVCKRIIKVHLDSAFLRPWELWGWDIFGGVQVKNETSDCSLQQFSWTFHSHVQYGSTSCNQMWVNRRTNAKRGPQGDPNCAVKRRPSECLLMSLVMLPHSDLLSSGCLCHCAFHEFLSWVEEESNGQYRFDFSWQKLIRFSQMINYCTRVQWYTGENQ